ncbi:FecR family protein [Ramlibacter sp.]|uniref:FecR family protein n=1 Tax=Ramlibacter sp. TaxID=1917967 RepID=UPI0017EC73A8|nr:FecR family protein [Ramlibacter sp.]MBA2673416.1 FecR domain-containing protein [Ramlibacter sp.]
MPSRFSRSLPLALASLLACAGAWAQGIPSQTTAYAPVTGARAAAVGEVTLAVGPATRTSSDGVPEPVQRGTRILPGDRLDTAEGGMIHVRFIDGALVSLRPASRLWVEDYRYDPRQVSQSLVKFRLEQGVARAISGAAAEGAKERFRLNTPLVAIGVRGTDFVVRTSPQATTAAVNQGAIIMAPFDSGCLAQALGPCTSPDARLLSADMGHVLVEFRPQVTQPEIRPMSSTMLARGEVPEGPQSAAAPTQTAAPVRSSQPAPDDALSAALVQGLVRTASAGPTEAAPPLPPPALMWGRWNEPALAGDIAVARTQAAEGRSVTVGDGNYALYRADNASGSLATGLGAYDFSLQQSSAQFNGASGAVAAAVQGGQLHIDFVSRAFNTSLNVSSQSTGVVRLSGAGFVRDDGIFVDRSVAGQAIAGAAALDGKSAGYLFEKAAAGGTLTGITLWSRP